MEKWKTKLGMIFLLCILLSRISSQGNGGGGCCCRFLWWGWWCSLFAPRNNIITIMYELYRWWLSKLAAQIHRIIRERWRSNVHSERRFRSEPFVPCADVTVQHLSIRAFDFTVCDSATSFPCFPVSRSNQNHIHCYYYKTQFKVLSLKYTARKRQTMWCHMPYGSPATHSSHILFEVSAWDCVQHFSLYYVWWEHGSETACM